MSIFGSIMSAIFTHPAAALAPQPAAATGAETTGAPHAAPDAAAPAAPAAPAGSPPAPAAPAGSQPAPAAAPAEPVDVEAVLTAMAAAKGQHLNWRTSIVDLMTLLGLDHSLEQRKQLAHELGYTGSTDDSASMNIWLHKQVMTQLAANGGKVPDDLKV